MLNPVINSKFIDSAFPLEQFLSQVHAPDLFSLASSRSPASHSGSTFLNRTSIDDSCESLR